MKSLKQLRKDSRIYEIILQDLEDCEHKYCINLKDGYAFGDDGGLAFCNTVAEINLLMHEIIPIK